MADEADKAGDTTEKWLALQIAAARGDIKPGNPGVCEYCGEESPRLVGGACAPCRDKYNLD